MEYLADFFLLEFIYHKINIQNTVFLRKKQYIFNKTIYLEMILIITKYN